MRNILFDRCLRLQNMDGWQYRNRWFPEIIFSGRARFGNERTVITTHLWILNKHVILYRHLYPQKYTAFAVSGDKKSTIKPLDFVSFLKSLTLVLANFAVQSSSRLVALQEEVMFVLNVFLSSKQNGLKRRQKPFLFSFLYSFF